MKQEMVADFEVTSIRKYKTKTVLGRELRVLDQLASTAFVCAWALAPIGPKPEILAKGRNINDFINSIISINNKLPVNENLTIFTHNLKYDAEFLIYEILRRNKLGDTKITIENEVRDNQLYSFDFVYTMPTEMRTITFRDSLKIFPCTVSELGDLYGIEKLKGDWDYDKYRDDTTPISDDEWEYVYHDVKIVARALADYREKGLSGNTAAGIAYNQRLLTTYKFDKSKISHLKSKNYDKYLSLFPFDVRPLDSETHKKLLRAYFGGWTWLNPHFCPAEIIKNGRADGCIDDVESYDENSMYPDKMAHSVLPIGAPKIYTNPSSEWLRKIKTIYPCRVYHLTNLTIQLKSENHYPMLMFPTTPETSVRCQGKVITCENEDVWLTNLDTLMMRKEYDVISAKVEEVICFKGKEGQYAEFVEYWMNEKANATTRRNELKEQLKTAKQEDISTILNEISICNQRRSLAKLMMNSSYGKDGTKLLRDAKTTVLTDDNLLARVTSIEESVIEYFIPSALFITAYARFDLYSLLIQARGEAIYSDTDSLKCTPQGRAKIEEAARQGRIKIDDAELGAWKDEEHYKKAKFVRQKTYATFDGKEWSYTACGATEGIKSAMLIDNFDVGMIVTLQQIHNQLDPKTGKQMQGKLVPVPVTGGVILNETGFQITEYEDWDLTSKQNMPITKFIEFMRNLKGEKI